MSDNLKIFFYVVFIVVLGGGYNYFYLYGGRLGLEKYISDFEFGIIEG